MGIVFEGVQEFLDRRVAIKVVRFRSSRLDVDEFNERFRREAQILAELKHSNIVTCFDSGVTSDGRSYMVMEYVDGPGNLWQWTNEHGPLSTKVALDVCAKLADALEYAWNQGVIHRDVKPENVLFEDVKSPPSKGQRGFLLVPKLIDLGIARAVGRDQLTQAGHYIGTHATMAPEQIEFPAEVDYRADIYGLGCVLYHALTGLPAFGGPTGAILDRKRKSVPDPRAIREVPDDVADFVGRMLEYDREKRPQSYREIIDFCQQVTGARPEPRRRGGRQKGWRSWRRSSWAFVGAAVIAVVAVGYFSWPDSSAGPVAVRAASLPAYLVENDGLEFASTQTELEDAGFALLLPRSIYKLSSNWGGDADDALENLYTDNLVSLEQLPAEQRSLPAGSELVCRLLVPAGRTAPVLAGLVIQARRRPPIFVGLEQVRDGSEARALVAEYPQQLEARLGRSEKWVLDPVASEGTAAVLDGLVQKNAFPFSGPQGNMVARLLFVRVTAATNGFVVQFGEFGSPGAGIEAEFVTGGFEALTVDAIVLDGKAYFYDLLSRPLTGSNR